MTHFYWGFYGSGFIELDEKNNVSQFLYIYKVSEQFIEDNNLVTCKLGKEIRFNDLDELKIVSNINDVLTVDIKPKILGICNNENKIIIRVRYGIIKEFD